MKYLFTVIDALAYLFLAICALLLGIAFWGTAELQAWAREYLVSAPAILFMLWLLLKPLHLMTVI